MTRSMMKSRKFKEISAGDHILISEDRIGVDGDVWTVQNVEEYILGSPSRRRKIVQELKLQRVIEL